MPTFSREGHALAYDVVGDGPCTVVCLPGMGDLRSSYRHLAPRLLADGWRVVTLDLRGHGDSDVGFDRYDPPAVGGDVIALLDHLGVERAVVAGNSAGAAAAVWAAAEAPDRVDGLVLLGPVVRDAQEMAGWMRTLIRVAFLAPWGAWLWRMFYGSLFKGGAPSDHAAHVARVVANARRPGRLAAALEHGMTPKAPCSDRVGEVRCPVVAVLGSADPDYPDVAAEADWLRGALTAEVTVLDGVGHYPHVERTDDTAAVVLPFLRGLACRAA
ncbi:MAG: alpha/beta hydrolase [Alphaproteobacteria bacterium]|nr:alpha/beta hydrolase [Alphaproteobacteria bacterium]